MKTYLPIGEDTFKWENFKLTMSMEGYDSILGGPRPNGTSKNWYLKEFGQIKPPLTLGKWNFFDEENKWFSNKMLRLQHQPHVIDQHHCHYKYKEELGEEEHLYLITVFNPHYFTENRALGFSVMDERFQTDVRAGKCAVIIFYPWEGYSGMEGNEDFKIVEEWRKKANFPPKSVHFFTGNLTATNHPHNKDSGTVFHCWSTFDNWNSDTADEPLVDFIPDEEKYLYLSYNRNPRKPRVYLGIKLLEEGLLDKGIVSLGRPEWIVGNNTMRQDGVKDRDWAWMQKNLPIELDKNLHFNLACNITHQDFTKTFCSIVTETLVEEGTIFISEKIWKCLQVGHPFFLVGNRFTLNVLRNLGYQTFNEWFDESYDSVDDYRLRVNAIISEIRKFEKYSKEDLKIIRNEMKEVLEFNKKRHYTQLIEKWGFHKSEKPVWVLFELEKIYKELVYRNKVKLI